MRLLLGSQVISDADSSANNPYSSTLPYTPSNPLPSNILLRCSTCYGYINPYCVFTTNSQWKCSLCRSFNTIAKLRI